MAKILSINPSQPEESLLGIAASTILRGGVVVFPTETLYGLGASIDDRGAIERVFSIKRRDSSKPLLILIENPDSLSLVASHVPAIATRLMDQFWPGPLTILFPASPHISHLLTAGTGKIGIRASSHPVCRGLVRRCGVPITGTSANISGMPGCSRSSEVIAHLGSAIDLILDAGETPCTASSTIVDVTSTPPSLVREGAISFETLREFLSNEYTNLPSPWTPRRAQP